jgi:hypothetical protein
MEDLLFRDVNRTGEKGQPNSRDYAAPVAIITPPTQDPHAPLGITTHAA